MIKHKIFLAVLSGFSPITKPRRTNGDCCWQRGYSSKTGGLPRGTWSRNDERSLQTGCHVILSLASTASLREPARRKKAAECWNRCFPSREKAFFSAAFLHRSSLKLFRKNSVILAFFWDLRTETKISCIQNRNTYAAVLQGLWLPQDRQELLRMACDHLHWMCKMSSVLHTCTGPRRPPSSSLQGKILQHPADHCFVAKTLLQPDEMHRKKQNSCNKGLMGSNCLFWSVWKEEE